MRWNKDTRTLYLDCRDLRTGARSTLQPVPTDLKHEAFIRFIEAVMVRYNRGNEIFVMKDRRNPSGYLDWPGEEDTIV